MSTQCPIKHSLPIGKYELSDADPTLPTVGHPREQHSHTDLLAKALQGSGALSASIREYAREAGIIHQDGTYHGFEWSVSEHALTNITALPKKYPHSGGFTWIGEENQGLPKRLWDSVGWCTVDATPERLQCGYVAVSWTWGRYQIGGLRRTRGTSWAVPKLHRIEGRDLLTRLKWLLRGMSSTRYFWVDLLCINQGSEEEKSTEISKQAHIFAKATGVINFLWTLNHSDLTDSLIAFGDLLSRCFHFGRQKWDRQNSFPSSSSETRNNLADTSRSQKLFQLLRGDNWFTSLWALQEIVLAPAGLWITHDGYYCTINQKLLTTRLFACAVRLLSSAQQRREGEWVEVENSYLKHQNMSRADLDARKENFDSEEHKRRRALRNVFDEQKEGCPIPDLIVLETERTDERLPCIVQQYHNDRDVRDEAQQWMDWAYGMACIDVSLSATRAAILLAGRNRHVIEGQSRELALIAALKLQTHPGFIFKHDEQTRQANLLNVILKEEGVSIFNVAHASINPTVIHRIPNDADLSAWEPIGDTIEFLHVQDVEQSISSPGDSVVGPWTEIAVLADRQASSIQYLRNGRKRFVSISRRGEFLLTSMSPYTGDRLNPQSHHFLRQGLVKWESSDGWHMHDAGCLHIPARARIQSITKKGNGSRFFFRPNGSREDYEMERLSDQKHIWRTQQWLLKKLGKPQFIFLPLGTMSAEPSPHARPRSAWVHVTNEQAVVGVVLVGHQSHRKDMSMTVWYKFGLYRGWGEFEELDWNDGIVVVSACDEYSAKAYTTAVCGLYQQRAVNITKTLNERLKDGDGFEVVRHFEVYDDIGTPLGAM